MGGIGPPSKAYESFVLPLNYTDMFQNIAKNGVKSHFLLLSILSLLRRPELHRLPSGYEPDEQLLLFSAIVRHNNTYSVKMQGLESDHFLGNMIKLFEDLAV